MSLLRIFEITSRFLEFTYDKMFWTSEETGLLGRVLLRGNYYGSKFILNPREIKNPSKI
jgi:hypothetical protein